ncbi:uncharacterized protein A4U43_C06F17410 [Asparagus officinalis]|uniref:Uncharacterized protein n=1 Tax=Asparagus officinalis TaxID=4686 RepID=A0A5P1EMG4_ASPOF|nr:uncharacterized protein A4U43_C06F17410 [Asparagus officinalis]
MKLEFQEENDDIDDEPRCRGEQAWGVADEADMSEGAAEQRLGVRDDRALTGSTGLCRHQAEVSGVAGVGRSKGGKLQ